MSIFALSPPSLCLQAHAASRERRWPPMEACCVSGPVTKLKTARSGPRVLRIVCSARCARLDVLIVVLRQPSESSCRSTLQAGARRYQLVCALVVPPVLLVRYSPGHRRSTPSASLELRVLSRRDASNTGGGGVVDVATPVGCTDDHSFLRFKTRISPVDYRSF